MTLDDSSANHLSDTLTAGCNLSDEAAARVTIDAAQSVLRWLARVGVGFDRYPDGRLHLGREGGHHWHRIAHAGGDATRVAVSAVLVAAVRAQRHVEFRRGGFGATCSSTPQGTRSPKYCANAGAASVCWPPGRPTHDRVGRPLMHGVHPRGDLAPRVVVARAITLRLRESGDDHALLDATRLGGWAAHFPQSVCIASRTA
ncbi:FAD-binding protein [Streptomyces sp. BA2]|uniref:FAD-binding protein n=1 Tax=Streptomyces sp. BA2 TaxID=436595 RepID=UPI003FA6D09D